jgi:hypothetical protein
MKKLLCLFALCLATLRSFASHEDPRFRALGMLETGNDDYAIGSKGEVSRYQIMPDIWPKCLDPHDPELARHMAQALMTARVRWFQKQFGIEPGPYNWALLWHCPHRIKHPTASDRDYANRFVNLVQKYSHNYDIP